MPDMWEGVQFKGELIQTQCPTYWPAKTYVQYLREEILNPRKSYWTYEHACRSETIPMHSMLQIFHT